MQQIIVYRNPIEAAIWNGSYGEYIFPVICGMVLFALMFALLNKILFINFIYSPINKVVKFIYTKTTKRKQYTYYNYNNTDNVITYVSLGIALMSMLILIYKMIL